MFESGYKLADAWSKLYLGASDTMRTRNAAMGGASKWAAGEARTQRDRLAAIPSRRKKMYGAGVVGVSSGAFMWHRHKLQQDQYDPGAPYYY